MADEFRKIKEDSEDSSESSQIASLERELERERDSRKEERFAYIVLAVIVLDIHVLDDMSTWTAPVVIGVLQLVLLLGIARKMGVEDVALWVDKFLGVFKSERDE